MSYFTPLGDPNTGNTYGTATSNTTGPANNTMTGIGCAPMPLTGGTNVTPTTNTLSTNMSTIASDKMKAHHVTRHTSRPSLQIVPLPNALPSAPAPPQIPSHMQAQRQQSQLRLSVASAAQYPDGANGSDAESKTIVTEAVEVSTSSASPAISRSFTPIPRSFGGTSSETPTGQDGSVMTYEDQITFCCQREIRTQALARCIASEAPIVLHAMIPGADVHRRNGPRQFSWSESHVQRSLGDQALKRVREYVETHSDVLVARPPVCACEAGNRVGEGLLKHAPPVSSVVYHSLASCPVFQRGSETQASQIALRAKARHEAIVAAAPHTRDCHLRKHDRQTSYMSGIGNDMGMSYHPAEHKSITGFSGMASESAQINTHTGSEFSTATGAVESGAGIASQQQQQSRASPSDRGVLGSHTGGTAGHPKQNSSGWALGSTFRGVYTSPTPDTAVEFRGHSGGGTSVPTSSNNSNNTNGPNGTSRSNIAHETRKGCSADPTRPSGHGMANGDISQKSSITQASGYHSNTMNGARVHVDPTALKHARVNSASMTPFFINNATVTGPQALTKHPNSYRGPITGAEASHTRMYTVPQHHSCPPVEDEMPSASGHGTTTALCPYGPNVIAPGRHLKPVDPVHAWPNPVVPDTQNSIEDEMNIGAKEALDSVQFCRDEWSQAEHVTRRYSLESDYPMGPLDSEPVFQARSLTKTLVERRSMLRSHASGDVTEGPTELNVNPPSPRESESSLTSHHESPPVPGQGYFFSRRSEVSHDQTINPQDSEVEEFAQDTRLPKHLNHFAAAIQVVSHCSPPRVPTPDGSSDHELRCNNGRQEQALADSHYHYTYDPDPTIVQRKNLLPIPMPSFSANSSGVNNNQSQLQASNLRCPQYDVREAQSHEDLVILENDAESAELNIGDELPNIEDEATSTQPMSEQYYCEAQCHFLPKQLQQPHNAREHEMGRVHSHGSHIYRRSQNQPKFRQPQGRHLATIYQNQHNTSTGRSRAFPTVRMGSAPKLILRNDQPQVTPTTPAVTTNTTTRTTRTNGFGVGPTAYFQPPFAILPDPVFANPATVNDNGMSAQDHHGPLQPETCHAHLHNPSASYAYPPAPAPGHQPSQLHLHPRSSHLYRMFSHQPHVLQLFPHHLTSNQVEGDFPTTQHLPQEPPEPLEISDAGSVGHACPIQTTSFHASVASLAHDRELVPSRIAFGLPFHRERAQFLLNARHVPNQYELPPGSIVGTGAFAGTHQNSVGTSQRLPSDARVFQRDLFDEGYYYQSPQPRVRVSSRQVVHDHTSGDATCAHPMVHQPNTANFLDARPFMPQPQNSQNLREIMAGHSSVPMVQSYQPQATQPDTSVMTSPTPIAWLGSRHATTASEAPSFANEFSAEERIGSQ